MTRRPPNGYRMSFGSLSWGIGLVLLIAPERSNFGGASSPVWGTVFVVIGTVLMLAFTRNGLVWMLRAGAVAFVTLAGAFAVTATSDPTGSLTAVVAYVWIALIHLRAARKVQKHIES